MNVRFTRRELDIMAVLWDCGPSTVSEVREALQDELAYTTVLTMLRVLKAKGYVTSNAERRVHRYAPLVDRSEAAVSALRNLTRKLYGGSCELVLSALLCDEQLSDAEVLRMRDRINERLNMLVRT